MSPYMICECGDVIFFNKIHYEFICYSCKAHYNFTGKKCEKISIKDRIKKIKNISEFFLIYV